MSKVYSIDEFLEEFGPKISPKKTTADFKFNYSIHDLSKMKEDCLKYISDRFGIELNINTKISWTKLACLSGDFCSVITDDSELINNIFCTVLKFEKKFFSILVKELKRDNYKEKPGLIIQECMNFMYQNYHINPVEKLPMAFEPLKIAYLDILKDKYLDDSSTYRETSKVISIFEKAYNTYTDN